MINPMIFDTPELKTESYISQRITKIELSKLRRMNKMTQKDLSRLSGLSTQCISDIESEKSGNPTFKSIMKYLNVLGYELYFRPKIL